MASYYAIIPANVRYDKNITPNAKLLYGEITALCNEKGYCWAGNEYFSDLYGVSKVSVSKWIKSLVDAGYIESTLIYKEGSKEIEKRVITLSAGGIKEKLNTPIEEKLNTSQTKVNEGIKEKLNTPIKEKFKDNNTSFNNTINNTINNKDNAQSEIERQFEEFWNLYPKKTTKKQAKVKFGVAVKEHGYQAVMDGVNKYIAEINFKKTGAMYIKNPATFLYNECYLEEFVTGVKNNGQPVRKSAEAVELENYLGF